MRKKFYGRRFNGGNKYNKMDENKNYKENENPQEDPEAVVVDDVNATPADDNEAAQEVADDAVEELTEEQKLAKENEELKTSLEKEKKEYMFLMAEFDNFRKRTLREKSELINIWNRTV